MPLSTSCSQTKDRKLFLLRSVKKQRQNAVQRQMLSSFMHCTRHTVFILLPRNLKPTLCHCKVDLTHILPHWGVSLDSFPPKAVNGSHSRLFGIWGWKANHVFVCLICISIASLSFEWFVFKHEVGLCKHIQTCLCTYTHRYTSKHKNL